MPPQEAVEVYFEGEAMDVPAPTAPDALPCGSADTGGQWLLVEIDVARVNDRGTLDEQSQVEHQADAHRVGPRPRLR